MRASLLGDGSVLAFVLEADLSAFFGGRGDIQRAWKLGDQGGGLGGSWGGGEWEVRKSPGEVMRLN